MSDSNKTEFKVDVNKPDPIQQMIKHIRKKMKKKNKEKHLTKYLLGFSIKNLQNKIGNKPIGYGHVDRETINVWDPSNYEIWTKEMVDSLKRYPENYDEFFMHLTYPGVSTYKDSIPLSNEEIKLLAYLTKKSKKGPNKEERENKWGLISTFFPHRTGSMLKFFWENNVLSNIKDDKKANYPNTVPTFSDYFKNKDVYKILKKTCIYFNITLKRESKVDSKITVTRLEKYHTSNENVSSSKRKHEKKSKSDIESSRESFCAEDILMDLDSDSEQDRFEDKSRRVTKFIKKVIPLKVKIVERDQKKVVSQKINFKTFTERSLRICKYQENLNYKNIFPVYESIKKEEILEYLERKLKHFFDKSINVRCIFINGITENNIKDALSIINRFIEKNTFDRPEVSRMFFMLSLPFKTTSEFYQFIKPKDIEHVEVMSVLKLNLEGTFEDRDIKDVDIGNNFLREDCKSIYVIRKKVPLNIRHQKNPDIVKAPCAGNTIPRDVFKYFDEMLIQLDEDISKEKLLFWYFNENDNINSRQIRMLGGGDKNTFERWEMTHIY